MTAGVPVNVTQKVMGHENPSTTLHIYTHVGKDYGDAVRAAFDETAYNPPTIEISEPEDGEADSGSNAA